MTEETLPAGEEMKIPTEAEIAEEVAPEVEEVAAEEGAA